MNTTAIFVELIVMGVGATLFLASVVFSILGYDWLPLNYIVSLPAALPALSIIYVLGIIFDRSADRLFRVFDRPLRLKCFSESDEYYEARSALSGIRHQLQEYGKSRIRICRSWTLVWFLLGFVLPIFILGRVHLPVSHKLAWVAFVGCECLSLLTFHAWWLISCDNYKMLSADLRKAKDVTNNQTEGDRLPRYSDQQ